MPRFLVPPEMYPGLFRQGVGFFKPGDEIVLPDKASKPGDVPSKYFVPLDEESAELLVKHHGDKARPLPEDVVAAIAAARPKDDAGRPAVLRDAVAQMGLTDAKVAAHSGGGKRAADR